MGHHRHPGSPPPSDPAEIEDRRRRYARLVRKMREWLDDTSGFDERVGPIIEETLRQTAPRHFPED